MQESFDHPGKVLLAFPSTGHDISTRFMRSFWELDMWDRERAVQVWEALGAPESPNPIDLRLLYNYVALEATANLAKARNRICDEFLHNNLEAEWLWFVDTDMVFKPELMHQMVARAVEHDVKILGALCVILTADGCIPTMFIDDPNTITQVLLDFAPNQLAQLAATGTGCILIHRSVIQAMFDQSGGSTNCWFGFDIRFGDDGSEWALGEDVSFCLRAGEQGHKIYVDTTAHVGHHKGGRVYWPSDIKTMGVTPPEEPRTTDDNARA